MGGEGGAGGERHVVRFKGVYTPIVVKQEWKARFEHEYVSTSIYSATAMVNKP